VVAALCGGVGAARFLRGLVDVVDPQRVVAVETTGDDTLLHGLHVSPDHDTVVYTLAGLDDREHGWGLRGETWQVIEALERLGGETWFRLGDRDLATHLFRTGRLAAGARPTDVALALQAALGVAPRVLPMTDQGVRTEVRTDGGWLDFQDYFVRLRQEPEIREVRFRGIESARPSAEVLSALATARAIAVCPSNPFVAVSPILAVPGVREAIAERRAAGVPVVAVSPIVGGRALKGPADRMLGSLGHEPSALGIARLYADVVDTLVIDTVDAALADPIAALGIRPLVADTVMTDDASRAALGSVVLEAAATRS
jgi:LPPG:FO 2-phospho-L-lactate transferase